MRGSHANRPKLVTTFEGGDVFGEGAMCDLDRRLESAKAVITVDLLTIERDDMLRALGLAPNLHWRLVKKHAHLVVKALGETRAAAQFLLAMNLPDLVKTTDIFSDLTLRDRIRAFTRAKVTVRDDWRDKLINSRADWERRHFAVQGGPSPAGASGRNSTFAPRAQSAEGLGQSDMSRRLGSMRSAKSDATIEKIAEAQRQLADAQRATDKKLDALADQIAALARTAPGALGALGARLAPLADPPPRPS